MTDIIMTMVVLTVGITAISIMGNKMVQEIKRYHEVKARVEKREQERLERIAWMKRMDAKYGRA